MIKTSTTAIRTAVTATTMVVAVVAGSVIIVRVIAVSRSNKRGHPSVWPAVCCSRGFVRALGFHGTLRATPRRTFRAISRGTSVNREPGFPPWRFAAPVGVRRTFVPAIWWPHNLPTACISPYNRKSNSNRTSNMNINRNSKHDRNRNGSIISTSNSNISKVVNSKQ